MNFLMCFEIICKTSRRNEASVTDLNVYTCLELMITSFSTNLSLYRLMEMKKKLFEKMQDLLERYRY